MFGLVITGGSCDVVTIGRSVPSPLYFMERRGRPVMRYTKFGNTPEFGQAGKDRDKAQFRA